MFMVTQLKRDSVRNGIDVKIYILKDYEILNQMSTLRQITLQYKHQKKKCTFHMVSNNK